MRAETPQFYIEAKELQARDKVDPPAGLVRTGTAAGAGIGFCGAVLYLLCWLLFQLAVTSTGTTDPALLPGTAQWVTSMLLFLAYGLVGSIVLGALSGTVAGGLIRFSWRSQTPVLAWFFGTITSFVIVLLITIVMHAYGLHVDLAQRLRELTFPSMLFVIEGGLVGLWIHREGRGKPASPPPDDQEQPDTAAPADAADQHQKTPDT